MWVLTMNMTGFAGMKKSQLNRLHKETWLALGKFWRRRYLAGHFTHAGARKYRYALRKGQTSHGGRPTPGSYTWTKLKRQGHTLPLVFYGDSKRKALAEEKVSATRDGVKIRLPQGFNRRHPRSAVRMHDEIRAVTPRETIELARHWSRIFTGKLNQVGGGRRIRIAA